MSAARCLIWDFDGTLAFRPGNWTGAVCEVIARERPDLGVTPERVRPHLQGGFPWHAAEIVRAPCSADQWWRDLHPMLTRAICAATAVDEAEADHLARGVRATYTDPAHWRLFDDVQPTLKRLRDRGWTHVVLSNHVPELAG